MQNFVAYYEGQINIFWIKLDGHPAFYSNVYKIFFCSDFFVIIITPWFLSKVLISRMENLLKEFLISKTYILFLLYQIFLKSQISTVLSLVA